ncbi:hypothetical protein ACFL6U_20865 [Planctomycetota bacterium]
MDHSRPVVLIESDALGAMTVRRAFEKAGRSHSLVHCADVVGAFTYLRRAKPETPSLLLLGIDSLNGETSALMNLLKTDPALNDIPIVVLAEAGHSRHIHECLRQGANDYLIKPPDYDLLGKEISRFLARWNARSIAAA